MTSFYFQVEMTKSSGRYWTLGLNLDAESYNEALRLFRAWAFGVEAVSSLTPHLRNLSDSPTPDRSYFNLDSSKTIFKELGASFLDKDSYDPDPDSDKNDDEPDDWSHDPNDNCPF